MSGKKAGDKRPIIIKREEVVEGGHHGGAWKVAYADFVTAMMAFFLLMWLLNATTEEQRRGLADYFSPMNAMARGASGTGQPFGGKTPYDTGELVSDRGTASITPGRNNEQQESEEETAEVSMPHTPRSVYAKDTSGEAEANGAGKAEQSSQVDGQSATKSEMQNQPQAQSPTGATSTVDPKVRVSPDAKVIAMVGTKSQTAAKITARAAADEAALEAEQDRRERSAFDAAAQQIREAIHGDKLLEDLAKQVAIDETPEGLRIQLLDEDHKPMFALGSSAMADRARQLLQKVAGVLVNLPEPISIAGHTDAAPYASGGKSNWDLSSERANATRRILVEAGLQEGRLRSVTGNADRDLLLPADPLAAANRRIAILVLRTSHSAAAVAGRRAP